MPADLNYSSRVLGLHFNGSDNSTAFVDHSPNPKTITANGNAKIVGNVGVFDGNGDYLSATIPSAIGTSDFTIFAKVKVTTLAHDHEIFCIGNATNVSNFDLVVEIKTNGALRGSVQNGSGTANLDITTASGLISLNTEYHVAFIVSGTVGYLYVNGVLSQSGTITGTRSNGVTQCRIGFLSTDLSGAVTRFFEGTIDEFYLWKGVALFTADFTPPTDSYAESYSNINLVGRRGTIALTGRTPNLAAINLSGRRGTIALVGRNPIRGNINITGRRGLINILGLLSRQGQITLPGRRGTIALTARLLGAVITKPQVVGYKYLATIQDSEAFEIPISSINATMRDSGSVTFSGVCPDGPSFSAQILSQSGGTLRIRIIEYYLDGTSAETQNLTLSNLEITYSKGSKSYSITIQGTMSLVFPSLPRTVYVSGIQFETLQANGAKRIRCDLDKDVLPKDVVIFPDGNSMTVGQVQYIIGQNSKSMELAELV